MVNPIKGRTEINLHDPSILPTLQCTLQCMGHTEMCITGTQTIPISKLGGWKHTIAFQWCAPLTNRYQMLKLLRQYWCYGNRSVIGNRGRWFTFRNWGEIGLSSARRETSQTNKQPKHYTKTGGRGHNISSSLPYEKEETCPDGK